MPSIYGVDTGQGTVRELPPRLLSSRVIHEEWLGSPPPPDFETYNKKNVVTRKMTRTPLGWLAGCPVTVSPDVVDDSTQFFSSTAQREPICVGHEPSSAGGAAVTNSEINGTIKNQVRGHPTSINFAAPHCIPKQTGIHPISWRDSPWRDSPSQWLSAKHSRQQPMQQLPEFPGVPVQYEGKMFTRTATAKPTVSRVRRPVVFTENVPVMVAQSCKLEVSAEPTPGDPAGTICCPVRRITPKLVPVNIYVPKLVERPLRRRGPLPAFWSDQL